MTSDPTEAEIDELLDFALKLARAAGDVILPFFRQPLDVENKEDGGFDPVTEADKAGERAMRELIEAHYPDHGINGEEYGIKQGASGYQWILDPVDGTRSFISGMPTWMTLVGLSFEGRPVAGVASQPFIGEYFYGSRSGAFLRRGDGDDSALKVRPAKHLASAMVTTTKPDGYQPGREKTFLEAVKKNARNIRYDGDAYFFCLLAAGQIDVALDAGLQSYDIAALVPVIEGAGGIVTTWDGESAIEGGNIIAAASEELHRQTLALIG